MTAGHAQVATSGGSNGVMPTNFNQAAPQSAGCELGRRDRDRYCYPNPVRSFVRQQLVSA